jgi:hypothetical protein
VEEVAGHNNQHFFWASRTDSAVIIDTLPFNGLGTFGYVWIDPQLTGELLPFGMGHVPGASLIMFSTRTEMCGIFAALTHLRLIVEFFTSFSARKPRAAFIVTVGLLLPGSMTNTTKTLGPRGGVDSTTISR